MTRYTPQWLQSGSYAAGQDRRLLGALWPAPASTGCAVTAGAGMSVNVAAGQVAVPSQNNTGSTLCSSDAVEPVTIAAASGSNPRIDLIICQPRGNDLDGGANNDFIFTAVTGVPAASPTVPAVPAGAAALAQLLVPTGSASVTAGNITDVRPGGLGGLFKPSPASVYLSKAPAGYPVSTQTMFTGTLPSLAVPGTLIATLSGPCGFTNTGSTSGVIPDLKRTDLNTSLLAYNTQTFSQPALQVQTWSVPLVPLAIPAGSAIPISCTVQLTGGTTIYCGAYLTGHVYPS